MIRLDVVQGEAEWAMARVGVATASQFDKLLTAGGKPSKQMADYAHTLLAEQLLQVPMDNASSGFMERGILLEKRALALYELQKDCDTEPGGFVMRDDRRVGCSTDRFVGVDGLLEIKCPSAPNHIGYLLDDEGIGYKQQVQGQLWLCERTWCDTLSYNPELPPALVRQHRDDKYIALLAAAVEQLLSYVDECKVKLKAHGLFAEFEQPQLRVVA